MKLNHSFSYEIEPIPPYNFKLTVQKPAGWPLFTRFEIYEKETLWSAAYLNGILVGLKLSSNGNPNSLRISATLFFKTAPSEEKLNMIKKSLVHSIGADDDLTDFYAIAKKDPILKYVVNDLHGMHSTPSGDTVFPDALLAILLQMAPLKRSNEMMDCLVTQFGDAAEFDGKKIYTWPLPKKLASQKPETLAKACKIGYRAKRIVELSKKLVNEGFPSLQELEKLSPEEAKNKILELPGIGDYSADIINPHGGFPIDVWSAEVFAKLFYGKAPENNRQAVEKVKAEGVLRWGKWSWMAFFYIVQDLENLSKKIDVKLRLA